MQIPFTFEDLSIVLAIASIILMITAELTSPHYGMTNLTINKKKLKNAALIAGSLFLVTVAFRIYTIIAFA